MQVRGQAPASWLSKPALSARSPLALQLRSMLRAATHHPWPQSSCSRTREERSCRSSTLTPIPPPATTQAASACPSSRATCRTKLTRTSRGRPRARLRVPASCLLYVSEALDSLPLGLTTVRTSLGRAVRTACCGTTGAGGPAARRAPPWAPVVHTHGTRYVRQARGWYAYGVRTVREAQGKLPCASGTYSTQEAGTRSSYVQYGGSVAYVSA